MKTNQLLRFLLLLNPLLLLANCVQEIDFSEPNADAGELVVNGRISNLPGTQLLRLTVPGEYGKQGFSHIPGATVVLHDDAGNNWSYEEYARPDTINFYYLNGFEGIPGRTYSLDITLANGHHYRCAPQLMPEPIPMDSVSVKGEQLAFTRSDGTVAYEPHAAVYAYTKVPAAGQTPYLRWDANAVYIFNEIVKVYDPFGVQHQCFITNYFNGQNIQIADATELQGGASLERKVGLKRIDNAFDIKVCFNVYQMSISGAAYDYWKKVDNIISASGSIFDPPPARVKGNVADVDAPDHLALGFFEVAGVSVVHKFLNSGALGPEFSYLNNYCDYDWRRWPPVNHPECDNCQILANSTLAIPEYWQ